MTGEHYRLVLKHVCGSKKWSSVLTLFASPNPASYSNPDCLHVALLEPIEIRLLFMTATYCIAGRSKFYLYMTTKTTSKGKVVGYRSVKFLYKKYKHEIHKTYVE